MLPGFPTSVRPLLGVSRVLAIASGKGGVGKTTVAVNLALALRQSGASVGLYDADLYGPNVPLLFGVTRSKSINAFIPVARASAAPYIPPLERYGLKLMSIGFFMATDDPITPDPGMAGQIIRQTLQDVQWGLLDYLVIDLPPGTGEPQHTLLTTLQIHGVVVVTTPQDLSLMDASRSLEFYRKSGAPVLGVVENMSYLHCPHCGEAIEVFHRSERTWAIEEERVELLGRIPLNIAYSRGVDASHPLLQPGDAPGADSMEAEVFSALAARLAAKLSQSGSESHSPYA
jgi:ATP-binding protein involved in chromosome partitioning